MWIWRSRFFQWMKLLVLSSAISFALFWFHLPAALLLGPMIAGICLSLRGAEIRVPRPFFIAAQMIIGCMITKLRKRCCIASSRPVKSPICAG